MPRALLLLIGIALLCLLPQCLAATLASGNTVFPRGLTDYPATQGSSLPETLSERIQVEPFNLVATLIFLLAIVHTFLAPMFLRLSHRFERRHQERLAAAGRSPPSASPRGEVSFVAEIFHFLGEVEAIFGIWVVPLLVAITLFKGWPMARDYLAHGLNFTEPLFVVVIMTMAASRPILKCSERAMALVAAIGKGSPAAWWFSILTVGPILGSLITEPAAMTISALLLAQKFYGRSPSAKFAYATLGLLFVNISVGGTLTHFAAPPVLMVAGKWGWGSGHMFMDFGWKAVLGIVAANCVYFAWFRREFKNLAISATGLANGPAQVQSPDKPVPSWITTVHITFLAWTVLNNHYPALFIGGFLFYLAFLQATEHHQGDLALRPALLVGFFLAGLVVHGGLQGWWIAPVLSGLTERPLFFGAALLTAFNDNAAITYLAALVPGFSDALKHAVVAGAVVGGGLTVIANAPNPAGQSILSRFFPAGISPLRLFLGAFIPTAILAATFLVLR
ncbi:MAG TPA: putative Na+/H+ antiporter [Candidatus Acidoferrum sp.]|nr:putative Na+/H+ antiporter [Candidatus Acidoferrum sp.]